MFGLPILNDSLKPVKFHPYTSRVHNRLLEVECGQDEKLSRAYRELERELLGMFERAGIKAWADNKIVFELEDKGTRVFYGFYDWKFSLGLEYYDENEHRYGKKVSRFKARKVYAGQEEYHARADLPVIKEGELVYKLIEDDTYDHAMFAYPSFIKDKCLYAEDVEEAIIQQLEKAGLNADELRQCHFTFDDPETGKPITCQVLKVSWK